MTDPATTIQCCSMERLLRLLAWLPLPLAHALGVVLGTLFFLVPNEHRKIAKRNLQLCFPQWSCMQQSMMLWRVLCETGKTIMETPILWFCSDSRFQRMIRSVNNHDIVNAALQQSGVLMATFHLGSWELAGAYCSRHFPMTTLYRPPRQSSLETIIKDSRARFGADVVAADGQGIRVSLKTLLQKGMVGILPDQDPRENGNLFAPLFGIAANTMTLYGRLLQKSHARAVFCTAERLSWGRGFVIHFAVNQQLDSASTIEEITVALNQEVERQLRWLPAQYQWSYRRFRTRPDDEADLY